MNAQFIPTVRRPVLFLDSGIGGLPYGHAFRQRNGGEKIVCVADRANFPYGKRSREELIGLLCSLTEQLVEIFDPKILVLACNTASVSALASLRERFPHLPIVGTVPAVKPAALASRTRRIGVLATERSIADPYISELAARYGPDCTVKGTAAPELVEFVEHRYIAADCAERFSVVKSYLDDFRAGGVDAVVLGCTHFLIPLDEFRAAALDDISIHDSVDGICRRLETLLDTKALRAAPPAAESQAAILAVTGETPPEPSWQQWADHFGLTLDACSIVDIGGRL